MQGIIRSHIGLEAAGDRSMRLIAVALVTTLVAGLSSPRAHAESTKQRLDEIDARLAKIERVLSNQSLLDLAQRMDQIQSDIRELRGRVDELENTTQQLRKQRSAAPPAASPPAAVVAPSIAPAAPTSPAGAVSAAAGPPAAGTMAAKSLPATSAAGAAADGVSVDQTVYTQAMDALKAGSYSVASMGFKDFVTNYPSSPLAASAQYWLGETYYVTQDYAQAATAFRAVLQRWPDDRKAPDAMLRLGLTQYAMRKAPDARATLQQVTQKYPGTDAAKQAADRLQRMAAAGN
jgi:tol-pal system protein YbgF